MDKFSSSPSVVISSYFYSLISIIHSNVDQQLNKVLKQFSVYVAKRSGECSTVFRDRSSAKEYFRSARQLMVNFLIHQETEAQERLLLLNESLNLGRNVEREFLFSNLFANKSFLILNLDSLQKPFKLVLLVLDYFMDRDEKLIFK